MKKELFEIGQERAQVNFLVACAFAKGYKRFKNILGCSHPEVIIKIFGEEYASLFSVSGLSELFARIDASLIAAPKKYYGKLKRQFSSDYAKAKKAIDSKKTISEKIENGALALSLLVPYIAALRYYEVGAMRRLKTLLAKRNVTVEDKEMFFLFSPVDYTTAITKERIAFLKIALDYYKNQKNLCCIAALQKHAKIYSACMTHGSTQNR